MNWRHLQAFIWLRWRLLANQWRRAGAVNAFVMGILGVGALIMAIPLFIGCFALAAHLIPEANPLYLMLAWDCICFFFLLFWGIGLVTELQRNDPLSLSKFMHLPVSVNGAFLINYLSSLMSLTLLVFGPVMLAYALALIYVKGLSQLCSLALLAGFLLMVTALTYQFQGWLAALMSNPRRRRAVIVGVTLGFVLICQLPNLIINIYAPWNIKPTMSKSAAIGMELGKSTEEVKNLVQRFNAKQMDSDEYTRLLQAETKRQIELSNQFKVVVEEDKAIYEKSKKEQLKVFSDFAIILNGVLPIGWLPLGVMSTAEGRYLPAILGLLGMTSIGTISLWRAYRTTVSQFQGQSSNHKGREEPAVGLEAVEPPAAVDGKKRRNLLEAKIPGLSEPISAIALGGLNTLLRSPEAKMALITPFIMCGVFGTMMFRTRESVPELVRPAMGLSVIGFVLLGMLQLTGNQFGFDRDGFRVFVLSAAPRREILIGKNLAFAPLVFGISTIIITAVQVFCPMRIDHFLSMFPLMIVMFLMSCLFTNLTSIYTPVYLALGSLKPTNPKMTTVLLQVVMFVILFPISQAPAFLPIGVESLTKFMGWTEYTPVCLMLSIVECVVIVLVYRVVVGWQGGELQYREQRILETVTNRGL